MALEKCPKCGRMHYATDQCITVAPAKTATVTAPIGYRAFVSVPAGSPYEVVTVTDVDGTRVVKRDRHPPGYMAEYMRNRRAKIKEAK